MLEALEVAALARTLVEVVVSRSEFCCCGRSWVARCGYEQRYRGRLRETGVDGRWLLTAPGVGGASYVVIFAARDVLEVIA